MKSSASSGRCASTGSGRDPRLGFLGRHLLLIEAALGLGPPGRRRMICVTPFKPSTLNPQPVTLNPKPLFGSPGHILHSAEVLPRAPGSCIRHTAAAANHGADWCTTRLLGACVAKVGGVWFLLGIHGVEEDVATPYGQSGVRLTWSFFGFGPLEDCGPSKDWVCNLRAQRAIQNSHVPVLMLDRYVLHASLIDAPWTKETANYNELIRHLGGTRQVQCM